MPAAASDKLRKSYSLLQKTLSSGISDSDTTITPNNGTNIPQDTAVDFIIDRVDSNGVRTDSTREIITGVFNGTTFVNCVRGKDGTTAQSHSAGAVIEFTLTGNQWNDMVDHNLVEHNQDGTHSDITADSITTSSLTISGVSNDGWTATGGTHSVSTGYNSGNRSFLINTSTDLTGFVSKGMRYRVTRNTTPPTQCADLESSSSHYASKTSPTGITFTDDFTCEAWVKLESYAAGTIVSRTSTPGTNGFRMHVGADGTLAMNGGGEYITSYQSIPLNKWVHVAASLDMSGNAGLIYIDGVNVPATLSGSGTSLTQAGNLQVGAGNSTTFFDGKLADVRVWSDIRTATEIRDNMYAYPSDTTGLVAHFKLNGNFNDSSSNANNLTAQNSAVATNADNPWNATEYGIITNVTASTIQVFCPEGYGIPNETLTAPFYSTQSAPFGFPRDRGKWVVETLNKSSDSLSVASTAWQSTNFKLELPVGGWNIDLHTWIGVSTASTSGGYFSATLSTDGSTETHPKATAIGIFDQPTANSGSLGDSLGREYSLVVTAATTLTCLAKISNTAPSTFIRGLGSEQYDTITAECTYL